MSSNKILFIDDEFSAVECLREVLADVADVYVEFRGGYDGNWKEIVDEARSADLVLVDLRMPAEALFGDDERLVRASGQFKSTLGMSYEGVELIARMRQANVAAKIIVITRHSVPSEARQEMIRRWSVHSVHDKTKDYRPILVDVAGVLGLPLQQVL